MTRRGLTLNKEQIEQAILTWVSGTIDRDNLPRPMNGTPIIVMDDVPDSIEVGWISEEDNH